ncbi:MAG: hypothetical protein LUE27_02170 [Clostridia bacterium]|nr:hypothetical protein [Clostridia bacterium]
MKRELDIVYNDEIVPEEDGALQESATDQFRTLVLKRDRLRKEEEQIQLAYIRKFGELIQERFALRIECVKYKKSISYCQACLNRNEPIYADQLAASIEEEINGYYEQLENIKAVSEMKTDTIPEADRLKVKRIYKEIALMIHPDMHPGQEFSRAMKDLWERAKDAYERNDLDDIMETKVLVLDLLKEEPTKDKDIDEQYLAGKIKALKEEIDSIITSNPYRYKDVLDSDEAIEDATEEFKEEIEDLKTYLETLKARFAEFEITEVLN